jgi:hypothetical protein
MSLSRSPEESEEICRAVPKHPVIIRDPKSTEDTGIPDTNQLRFFMKKPPYTFKHRGSAAPLGSLQT